MRSSSSLSPKDIVIFQKEVYSYYHDHFRSFPWRETRDPYHILVSEFMLQQTQAERVVPKYEDFIKAFPTMRSLSDATPKDVLSRWKGLGYNRRALYLHRTARQIVSVHNGKVPDEPHLLEELPGIGPYTSRAIVTFSYDIPLVFIETNIRSVFLHCFLSDRQRVPDPDILALVEQTLDTSHPREWYYALMDYGAMIKKTHGNPNRKSRHHATQKPFEGSRRQKRGQILSELLTSTSLSAIELKNRIGIPQDELYSILADLEKEGFIIQDGEIVSLSDQ
jgi:A/G-specific adenine glycosylase